MRTFLHLLLAATLLACAAPERRAERPTPPVAPEPAVEAAAPIAEPAGLVVFEEPSALEGPACTRTADCDAGLACRGVSGCASDWACTPPRECGAERVAYCDCEGVTFYAPSGCPGRTYAHVGPCLDASIAETALGLPDGDEPITSDDRTCETSSDCPRWQQCFGLQGCGTGWRCERVRGCSRQRVEFCGCDGETFTASVDCPGRAFVRRGACDEVIASAETEMLSTAPPVTPPTTTTTVTVTPTTTTTPTPTPTTATVPATHPPTVASTPSPGGCTSSRDCRGGRVCTGPPGCGVVWTCEPPAAPCIRDTQVFCDCEGETFRASMTCPGRPHAHRGSCAMDQMLDLSGAALR